MHQDISHSCTHLLFPADLLLKKSRCCGQPGTAQAAASAWRGSHYAVMPQAPLLKRTQGLPVLHCNRQLAHSRLVDRSAGACGAGGGRDHGQRRADALRPAAHRAAVREGGPVHARAAALQRPAGHQARHRQHARHRPAAAARVLRLAVRRVGVGVPARARPCLAGRDGCLCSQALFHLLGAPFSLSSRMRSSWAAPLR